MATLQTAVRRVGREVELVEIRALTGEIPARVAPALTLARMGACGTYRVARRGDPVVPSTDSGRFVVREITLFHEPRLRKRLSTVARHGLS
ncbi:MAG: hypothetical protein AAGE52_26300 [Myxococcota bacterium]